MQTRRVLSVFLSLALLFSLLSAPARAADGDYEDDDYSFVASTGTLFIKRDNDVTSFDVPVNAVRYVHIASGLRFLAADVKIFSDFPNLIAFEVEDGDHPYYFTQDGVLLQNNYDSETQKVVSATLVSYPRGKTDSFTIPASVGAIVSTAFNSVTDAVIYYSAGVETAIVDQLKALCPSASVTYLGGTSSAASVELRQNGSEVPAEGFTLNIGEALAFSAFVLPDYAAQEVIWASSNPAVATVAAVAADSEHDSLATLTAQSAGTATLSVSTAELVDNQHITASCAVTVRPDPESISISGDADLRPDGETTLTAAVLPENAVQSVTWSSGNETVATVDSNGKVTAHASGTAVITAASTLRGAVTAQKTIHVSIPVSGVSLDKDELALTLRGSESGNVTAQLSATVDPENATNKSVTWSSSAPTVATVDENGLVTAVGKGDADITVTTADGGKTDTCAVSVTVLSSDVTVEPASVEVEKDRSVSLTATVLPDFANDRTVTWSSDHPDIASVDANGTVTGHSLGTATVTAAAHDGSGARDECAVTVAPVKVRTLSLNHNALSVEVPDTETLTVASAEPEDAADKSVIWTSSAPTVATVDENGLVTAVAMDEATITATAKDGSGATAACAVTVPEAKINALTMNPATLTLRIDPAHAAERSDTLTVTFDPAYATYKNLTWESLDPTVATVTPDPNDPTRATVTAVDSGTVTILASSSHGKAQETVTAGCAVTVKKAADSLTVTPEGPAALIINGADGENITQYTATVPAGTTDSVVWSSNNEAIATVDSTGKVTAVGNGEALITARCGSLSATRAVSVTVLPVSVTLNKATLSLADGGSGTLTATVAPAGVSNSAVTWSSSDGNVATVSSSGEVTAVGPGTAIITVTTASGSKTATCAVTVTPALSGLSLSDTALTLRLGAVNGAGVAPLTAIITPANAVTGPVGFVSSDPAVVTVSAASASVGADGKATVTLTARKAGDAVITVSVGGQTAFCDVTVEQAATSVALDITALILTLHGDAGTDSGALTATLNPTDATDALTWRCDNASVATVSGSGKTAAVTAVGEGRATVTATADSGAVASCTVTVSDRQIASLSLPETLDVYLNGSGANPASAELTLSVSPADTTGSIRWTNGNPDAVSLSEPDYTTTGNTRLGTVTVTAVGGGKSVISVAADNGRTAACTVSVKVLATGVTLDQSVLSLEQGATKRLTASIAPITVTTPALAWRSDDESVATVSGGVVTAVAPGTAHITASATDGSGQSATCAVTVTDIAVTGVRVSQQRLVMRVGDAPASLSAIVTPNTAANPAVSWVSSAAGVATVDSDGKVTAVGPGEAEITVKTTDGGFTAVCYVTVAATPVTSLNLAPNAIERYLREVTGPVSLTATVGPANATDKSVVWSSSNETVATVADNSDGTAQVTLRAAGSAVITARSVSSGSVYAVCPVTVRPTSVEAVSLSAATLELEPGGAANLTATVTPSNADNTAVTWSSSNESVATVDSGGRVTAVASGSAAVTVLSAEGRKSATCLVKVWKKVTGVTLSTEALSLHVGQSRELTATIAPSDAELQTLRWSSTDTSVATVDPAGRVIAWGEGNATVTVTTVDQSKTAACAVTVTPAPVESVPVTGVTLRETLTLEVSETAALSPTVTPSNADNTAVTWSGGDPGIATVDANGVVTAVGPGTVNITVTTTDQSKTATCAVTVISRVTGVSLDGDAEPLTLDMSATTTLSAAVEPSDASDKTLRWSSTNPAVATVANGVVTPIAPGTTAIIVTTVDGGFLASRTVNVVRAASGVTLTPTSLSLAVGHGAQLTAAVTGDATDAGIVWSAPPEQADVLTVTDSGYVTARGAGTATVTATAHDGSGQSASCLVTVYEPVTAVAIQKDSATVTSLTLNLVTGKTARLTAVPTGGAPTLQWSVEGDAVTVDAGGLVTARSAGTAVVTVTATTGDVSLSAHCAVTVEKAILTADKTTMVLTPDNRADTITFSPWRAGSSLEWSGAVDSVTRNEGEADSSFNKPWTFSALQNGVYTVSWDRSGDDNYEHSGGELTIYAVPYPITAVSVTTAGAAVASVNQQERRIDIAGTYTDATPPDYTLSYTLATDVLSTLYTTVDGDSVIVKNGDDTVCEYTIADNRVPLPENVTVSTQVSLMAEPGKVVDSGSVDITDAAAANLNAAAVRMVMQDANVQEGDVQVTLKLEKSVATEGGNQVLKLEILPTYTVDNASGELHELDAAVEISVTVNFEPTLIIHRHVAQDGSVSYEYPHFTATPNDESGSSYTVTWRQQRFSTVDLLSADAAAAYMQSLNTTLPPETPEEGDQPGDKPGDKPGSGKGTGAGGGTTGGGGIHNGSSSGGASRKPAEPAAPVTEPAVPSVPEVRADNVRSFADVPESHWAHEAIAYVSGRGIINGMSPRTFAPELSASRAMIAQILRNLDGGAQEGTSPFPDTAGKWFDAAAAWAAAKGVVNGVGGRFDGDTPVTREQFAVMLYRYAGLIDKADGDAAGLSRFRDADAVSPWAAEAMAWAVGRGLINGVSPATLSPQAGATRAQTAAILMRFCENVLK